MWDEQKCARFQELRKRQDDGVLTQAEQAELASLIAELNAAESAYLIPATQRLQQERETLEAQNRALEALVLRKEALVRRLRAVVAEAQAERQAIARELAAVLADNPGAEAGE